MSAANGVIDASAGLAVWLESLGGQVLRVEEPLAVEYEVTALQHALDRAGRYPPVWVRKPQLADGGIAAFSLATNLTASRRLVCAALGLGDSRRAAAWWADRQQQRAAPVTVPAEQAPVRSMVLEGGKADLRRLPATVQHQGNPGPYLTAAHATTVDPESGIDNSAIQRCWIKEARRMTWFPYPNSHNARNMRAWHGRGEPCPVALWVGHHPAVSVAAQVKLGHPESHWPAAGGLLGGPLRLTPSLHFGDRLKVPADAEFVIEGLAHPGATGADGPFAEYTGFLGPAVDAPICEVLSISHRPHAVLHDCGSGLADNLVPDNIAMEGRLYSLAKAVSPRLLNVHVPADGRRFLALLQFDGAPPGEVRDALAAALAWRRVKTAVAVDSDIDLFDARQVNWALATRFQWDRDLIRVDGLSTSLLDPSLEPGRKTASKAGLDATLRVGRGVPPVAHPDAAALARAEALLSRLAESAAMDAWPAC
ncbi:MAG: UbiD family decarboxylase [Gammaproteobacteria bacterium]|nr:UbiD family decarboxylase [Gammaproteobacteria bacterium]